MGSMSFNDMLRVDSVDVVKRLQKMGISVMLLSGDRNSAVTDMAQKVRFNFHCSNPECLGIY